MLIKELPKVVSNKTFSNIKEFLVFIYQEQIITEFWELSENEVSESMKKDFLEAKKLDKSNFINI